ncbi:hypothetical protein HK096_005984, partial [Nowakowskiella sp. JEL0078]
MGLVGEANSLETTNSIFVQQLNPAANHKVICAIDFGTSGIGYSYAFTKPNSEIDPRSEVFPNKPWPLTEEGKTSTSIVLKNDECVAFGKRASEFMSSKVRSNQRNEYQYFHNFKMQLYMFDTISNLTMLKDLQTGVELPAVDVIGECLKQAKKAFMDQISLAAAGTGYISDSDVLWVVTVPAIWKDGAKKVMRESAIRGGLINSTSSSSLLLVLEPEAASVWCLMNQHFKLNRGDIYVVVDCGGGTVDVTVHEITDENKSQVKEAIPVSGGDWGSTAIDRSFFQFIKDIVGTPKYDLFTKDSRAHLQLREEWEKRKCSFEDDDTETTISLPQILTNDYDALEAAIESYNQSNVPAIQLDSYQLILSAESMRKLFMQTIDKIVNHIDDIYQRNSQAKSIVIVGNFANCKSIQKAFRHKFEHKRVSIIVPPNPGTCVVNGAVLVAHRPSAITEHISRFSYGGAITDKYDPKVHVPSPYRVMITSDIDGTERVRSCMDWFVRVGEKMQYGKAITRTYLPSSSKQSAISVQFYETSSTDVIYASDPRCKLLGKISTQNLDYEQIRDQGVKYHILFGASEIHVISEDPKGNKHE